MMRIFQTTVCVAALCTATGAMADVTAQQVWDQWQSNFEGASTATLSASSEDVGNGVVTVSDMRLSVVDGEEAISVDIGTVTFTEQGDGTVAVQMEETYVIDVQSSDAESAAFEIRQSGLVMIAAGSDKFMNYTVSADRYAISVLEVIEGGEPKMDGDFLFTMNDLAGTFGSVTDELQDVSYDFDIGSIDLLADITEPGGTGTALISGKIEKVKSTSRMSLPLDFPETENPFVEGFGVLTETSFDSANFIFELKDDAATAAGSMSIGAGSNAMSMYREQLVSGLQLKDVALTVESSDLPIPVNIALSEIGTGLTMPLSVTEAPEDFSVFTKLTDLVVNDEIWNMGDQAGVLPRDPISIDLDLSGKTKLFFDILDETQEAAREQADVPGELHAISINSLLVSAAGAMVTGSGAFTFDNNDLSTFDGIPRPLGDATFEVTGANALIDNLVSMGLLPADQASMGRMMMGMFARSIGDDQLQTTVEVNAEGHLIVNGQRMQ